MPDSRTPSFTAANSATSSSTNNFANIIFWLSAALLLIGGLGSTGLWNSEDRWMEVAREMHLSGNYFRPTMNGILYFDKPLGSYWLVVLCSFFTGGINEWALRLPSALSALLSLWATIDLGKRLWSAETGRLAGWLLLTCYGFLMWGRSGEADMENMAASIVAVAWYWRTRAQPNFFAYFIFYLIIFIGAQTKGLTAVVVPILALACDILRAGRWRSHLRLSHLCAAALGSLIYILPFMLAESPVAGSTGDAGLLLVFRENVVRYFAPFDHDEPFYMYFLWLQVLWFPWLPVLWGACAAIFIDLKAQSPATQWLVAAFAAIFLFFLLSGSRRIYYILPLLPYCALLMALFLQRDDLQRLRRRLLSVQLIFLAALVILLLILPLLAPLVAARAHVIMPSELSLTGATAVGILAIIFALLTVRSQSLRRKLFGADNKISVLFGIAALILGGFFLVLRPLQDSYRTEWPFARELKVIAAPLPAAQIMALSDRFAGGLMYYAELPIGFSVVHTAEELSHFAQLPPYPKLILIGSGDFKKLPAEIARLKPVLVQQRQPWEKPRSDKMHAWLIDAAPD